MTSADDDRTRFLNRPAAAIAYLIQVSGARVGDAHQLIDGFTLGRGSGNDVRLDEASASDEHARIRLSDGGEFALTDLASTNSLKVNGAEATRIVLEDGDRIEIAETSFVFKRLAS